MNNLTTRKIVLGMLITLVLAFSVQGTADAVGDLNPGFATTNSIGVTDLGRLNIGSTITLNIDNSSANNTNNYRESVYVKVSGGGANFPNPTNTDKTETSYTWDEERGATAPKDYTNGTLSIADDVVITVHSDGEVTVTVSWTSTDAMSATRDKSLVRTYYVVKDSLDAPQDVKLSLRGVTNGVGSGYDHRQDIQIYSADSNHYPVTYSLASDNSGTLYIKEGNRAGDFTGSVGELVTSSGASVYLSMGDRNSLDTPASDGNTNTVTLMPGTRNSKITTGVYIYGRPTLIITANGTTPGVGSGSAGSTVSITAEVENENNVKVNGVPIKFEVVNTGVGGGTLIDESSGIRVDSSNNLLENALLTGDTLNIRTSSGVATVTYEIGTAGGEQVIKVSALRLTKEVKITNTSTSARQLSIKSEKRADEFDIIATVTENEMGIPNVVVEFEAIDGGELDDTPSSGTGDAPGDVVTDVTNAGGKAVAIYDPGTGTGDLEIVVSIPSTGTDLDGKKIRKSFFVRGGGRSDPPPRNVILITLSSTTGEPGEEVTINVSSSPSRALVTLGSNDFEATRFSPQSGFTPLTSTLLLPVEEGTHTFFATGGTFIAGRASVTVEAELGELSITAIGSPEAGLQTFSISAVDADGDRAIGTFTARLSGTGFTSRDVEIAGGSGNARLTLPTAASLYTLTVSATGYEDGETPVRIAGTGQQQVADEDEEEVEEEVTVAAEPDSIEITGPSTRSGTVNEELDTPLLVRVLDDDGDGLEGARVFYRVSSGRGRLSARGNGRAIGVVTDDDGYARASFTPLDGGTITVRANTDDLSATVTFTITTGSASSASGARDSGTGGTPGMISPVVHVGAASRPPMLWVDGGAIYALVGASPQRFAASVDNALNIAVGGGKVYWTEKTGESGGTINSANLNGSDVTELTSIKAVPMGIAVDTAGSKLYWTNSRGRIQSADLDGSGITNVMQNLPSPMDLALAGGNAYWTQGNGSVRFVNLRGQKVVRNVSTGTDTPGSLVIGGGKVYWTEMTGESGGTVNSANLNGTGATPLASILAAPMGIAVDGSRSKLYWSNSRGRIQSANLDGSGITNVVSGLGSPGDMVLSNSISAPATTTTTRSTTTASNKYDVNGDGSVNNADSDAITVAIAAGATDAKYDVNGDGTVNVFDLVEIIANRDPGAAGAPTLFGMKLSAVQIDIIEEQIDLLIAMNDRSPAALRTLIYLQQLLVTARPEKTLLLANYPNPFNPETWIPYELATDTHVRLTIYNTQGVVIRTLELGHQSAGYYVGRDRAAYWDGRNALGEQVASGLYFYQLETDEMSLMRKMVILK